MGKIAEALVRKVPYVRGTHAPPRAVGEPGGPATIDFRGCAHGARVGNACAAQQQFIADRLSPTTGPVLLS